MNTALTVLIWIACIVGGFYAFVLVCTFIAAIVVFCKASAAAKEVQDVLKNIKGKR